MKRHTSMSLVEVINSVTKIPARKLGVTKGELREGYDADIVIFDEDFSIISTVVAGELKYINDVSSSDLHPRGISFGHPRILS